MDEFSTEPRIPVLTRAQHQRELEGKHGREVVGWVIDRAGGCIAHYTIMIDPIRRVARHLGYAIGVHGTLARDIDLIAVPWTDTAVDAATLANAVANIAKAFNPDGWVKVDGDCPREKPHGRRCWSIHLSGGPYIDLSVMPRIPDVDSED